MSKLITKLNQAFKRMSARERRLAAVVATAVLLFLAVSAVRGAWESLQALDRRIDLLQNDLLLRHDQVARRQVVEAQYSQVAAQHSSAWPAPEIHDRLRQELYRLARAVPPPLDERGMPVPVANSAPNLVELPALGQGHLSHGADDYREFSIRFDLPSVEISSLLAFLQRLQTSPQSLRIDGLELLRAPQQENMVARIDLTRTIVAGSEAVPTEDTTLLLATPGEPLPLFPAEWHVEGGELQFEHAAAGGDALRARSTAEAARLYTMQALQAGATYEVSVDLRASGNGKLAVSLEGQQEVLPGAAELLNDGKMHRYLFRVTVPGRVGQPARLHLPLIELEGNGSEVHLENLVLNQVMG